MGIEYDLGKTAVILIGYQNDYFASDGLLESALEDSAGLSKMSPKRSLMGVPITTTRSGLVNTSLHQSQTSQHYTYRQPR